MTTGRGGGRGGASALDAGALSYILLHRVSPGKFARSGIVRRMKEKEACLKGEHEPVIFYDSGHEGDPTTDEIFIHLSADSDSGESPKVAGSITAGFIHYIADTRTRRPEMKQFGVQVCCHCRVLYVPREQG